MTRRPWLRALDEVLTDCCSDGQCEHHADRESLDVSEPEDFTEGGDCPLCGVDIPASWPGARTSRCGNCGCEVRIK